MLVRITNCPIPFHDVQELVEFLFNSSKFLYLFDGQRIFVDGVYSGTIKVLCSSFRIFPVVYR